MWLDWGLMGSSSFFPPGVGEGGGGMMSPPAHLCFFLCFLGRLHKALSKFCFSSVLQTFCRHLCFRMRVPDSPPGAEERGQGYLKHMGWELFGFIKASFFFSQIFPAPVSCTIVIWSLKRTCFSKKRGTSSRWSRQEDTAITQAWHSVRWNPR